MSERDLSVIPGMVLEGDEPVFNEPWEAHAFALVVQLHQNGKFTWNEWAETLGATIRQQGSSKPYYELWLTALETILSQNALVDDVEVSERQAQWRAALKATPHGKPVELRNSSMVSK